MQNTKEQGSRQDDVTCYRPVALRYVVTIMLQCQFYDTSVGLKSMLRPLNLILCVHIYNPKRDYNIQMAQSGTTFFIHLPKTLIRKMFSPDNPYFSKILQP